MNMEDTKKRFQTYLYVKTESDIIDFFNGLRKNDKRMVFISAMRMYMAGTGHYLRNNSADSIRKPAIPIIRDKGDHPGKVFSNDKEIEVLEGLSRLADGE
ncbi:Uncharacterized protein dnl_62450 [Desulfonema limicola]|uniref:Uncharacterized protein n=1 Tax=Desulfonema limicola TaxID=45656 RepID=A0A975BE38_9BACT|nr:hypothetical protein [Desulfonema limicola]QTA83827.1 Uncharacterized protein dnl_62450 [Desulfonema limicola]